MQPAVLTNLAAGGPLVMPAFWQIADVQVTPPQFRVIGDGLVQVEYGEQKATVLVANAAAGLAAAEQVSTATTTNAEFAGVNTTFIALPRTSGGGGGRAAPTMLSLTPTTGTTAGFSAVTLTGSDFNGATAVTIGGLPALGFTVNSATQISASVPAQAAGSGNVAVTTPGGTATSPNAYTYGAFISTIAGNGTASSTGDGGLATAATLNNPNGIAFNAAGRAYVNELGGRRVRVF